MHPLAILSLSAFCYLLCYLCLRAEKRSRKWWPDRALLFVAGFWFALGCAATVVALVRMI